MHVKILIPTPLRSFVGGAREVEVEARTVGDALQSLIERHAQLKKHLYGEDGKLRSFVNVYVNDEDVRYLKQADTPLGERDVLSIVPSVAGGIEPAVPKTAPPAPPTSASPLPLSAEEIRRYSRHLIMPEVGMKGQVKLKNASVLLIGAGGLGSPLALYLAAAGVGRIGIVDFDVVDESNLQRQLLHGTSDVGRPKLESARARLREVNPLIRIETHEARLTSENALELFRAYDIVADGTDNFPTRYLVNDACVLTGKPNVYGSIFRFEGQASIFATVEGPCYRCLYPEPPPPGLVPSCAEGGVLGVLPGVVGCIQATETIKLILGAGEPLIGRFLIFDALRMKFRELKLKKDPDCPVCGTHPTVTKLIDYEQFCGVQSATQEAPMSGNTTEISAVDFKKRLDRGDKLTIVDVREPHEYQINRIPGSTLIPLGDIPKRYVELDPSDEIVVHCKMGGRSAKAADFLRSKGYTKVLNLTGGILEWIDKVDPSQPKY